MRPLVREGYRRARHLTRVHARSFSLASLLLFGARRRAAFALYAFCRRLDDAVDVGPTEGLPVRLAHARSVVEALYGEEPGALLGPIEGSPFHPAELAALKDTLSRFSIPKQPFLDLLSGMEMDVRQRRYSRFEELDRYCYCVASSVGLMLCPVLGTRDVRALAAAADLGRAMQLTNILRDVKEDLQRGRIYLPMDELLAFGLDEADLEAGRLDDRMRAFLRCQIARARAYYARAARGTGFLRGFGTRRMVKLMGALYGGILEAIESQGHDVFSARARVPLSRKLRLVARALFLPWTVLPAPASEPAVPLLPTWTGP
jgi:15-cis-phytoene synthase